jgi:hypothetical protein
MVSRRTPARSAGETICAERPCAASPRPEARCHQSQMAGTRHVETKEGTGTTLAVAVRRSLRPRHETSAPSAACHPNLVREPVTRRIDRHAGPRGFVSRALPVGLPHDAKGGRDDRVPPDQSSADGARHSGLQPGHLGTGCSRDLVATAAGGRAPGCATAAAGPRVRPGAVSVAPAAPPRAGRGAASAPLLAVQPALDRMGRRGIRAHLDGWCTPSVRRLSQPSSS